MNSAVGLPQPAALVKYHSSGLMKPYAFGRNPCRLDWTVTRVPGLGCQKSGSCSLTWSAYAFRAAWAPLAGVLVVARISWSTAGSE